MAPPTPGHEPLERPPEPAHRSRSAGELVRPAQGPPRGPRAVRGRSVRPHPPRQVPGHSSVREAAQAAEGAQGRDGPAAGGGHLEPPAPPVGPRVPRRHLQRGRGRAGGDGGDVRRGPEAEGEERRRRRRWRGAPGRRSPDRPLGRTGAGLSARPGARDPPPRRQAREHPPGFGREGEAGRLWPREGGGVVAGREGDGAGREVWDDGQDGDVQVDGARALLRAAALRRRGGRVQFGFDAVLCVQWFLALRWHGARG
mmetsp:Transcript_33160/g.80569  ORF Transcript_33160/g.80569 Transcript_33160/m.80569 type:complete len:256 (-) Transcript_33160:251-1018(-)